MTDTEKPLQPDTEKPEKPKDPISDMSRQDIGSIRRSHSVRSLKVLSRLLELESINDELGILIGNLKYNEYRELAKIFMQLSREERKDENTDMSKARIHRLMTFITNSSSENIRNMKDILARREKFNEKEIMQELVLLIRLYYLKGINILNPESDKRKANTIRARDDRDIVVRIGLETIMSIRKSNGVIIASYINERNEIAKWQLRDGKIYIFGRDRSDCFTVKNCSKSIKDTLGGEKCILVSEGIPMKILSRVGLGAEVHGDEVSFYDRASCNAFTVSKGSKDAKLMSRQSRVSAFGSPAMFQDPDMDKFVADCARALRENKIIKQNKQSADK